MAGTLATWKVVWQVEHFSHFSQKMDRHTEHTKPWSMERLWQKQLARKSTDVERGSVRKRREKPSAANTESRYCRHTRARDSHALDNHTSRPGMHGADS